MLNQQELLDKVKVYNNYIDENVVKKAYNFAFDVHKNQKRLSGDPYITHPIAVAAILCDLKVDTATIITALLHDTIEDTEATYNEVNKLFGKEIADLVEGVTKISRLEDKSKEYSVAENFRKLILATSKDIRVLLVKLADRLHNMRTINNITNPDKRLRIAKETMEIYSPLAERMGMHNFRDELEDLAFNVLNPEARKLITDRLILNKERLGVTFSEISKKILKLLEEKDKLIELLEHKPETYGFERVPGYIYFIEDTTKPGHIKLGYATTPNDRVSSLNVGSSTYSLRNLVSFETFDKEFAEKIVHYSLNPFRIKNRKEWFYFQNQNEMVYALNTIKSCIEFIKKFDITEIKEKETINLQEFLIRLNKENVEKAKQIKELQKDKQKVINKINAEKGKNRSGNFKGTTFAKDKQLWKAEVQHNNKRVFLGYFTDEIDAAKVYNDYILFLNENENTQFLLNEIPGYITVARNIPEENKNKTNEKKTSKYNGVSYDSKRKYYLSSIKCCGKTYNLGSSQNEIECAKLYNQQALFFNNTLNTKYILNNIDDYVTLPKNIHSENLKLKKKSSKYYGVSITKTHKWAASYMLNRKKIHIGTFNTELEACEAYNKIVIELNKNGCHYKIN